MRDRRLSRRPRSAAGLGGSWLAQGQRRSAGAQPRSQPPANAAAREEEGPVLAFCFGIRSWKRGPRTMTKLIRLRCSVSCRQGSEEMGGCWPGCVSLRCSGGTQSSCAGGAVLPAAPGSAGFGRVATSHPSSAPSLCEVLADGPTANPVVRPKMRHKPNALAAAPVARGACAAWLRACVVFALIMSVAARLYELVKSK